MQKLKITSGDQAFFRRYPTAGLETDINKLAVLQIQVEESLLNLRQDIERAKQAGNFEIDKGQYAREYEKILDKNSNIGPLREKITDSLNKLDCRKNKDDEKEKKSWLGKIAQDKESWEDRWEKDLCRLAEQEIEPALGARPVKPGLTGSQSAPRGFEPAPSNITPESWVEYLNEGGKKAHTEGNKVIAWHNEGKIKITWEVDINEKGKKGISASWDKGVKPDEKTVEEVAREMKQNGFNTVKIEFTSPEEHEMMARACQSAGLTIENPPKNMGATPPTSQVTPATSPGGMKKN